jgi:hypothetical protein
MGPKERNSIGITKRGTSFPLPFFLLSLPGRISLGFSASHLFTAAAKFPDKIMDVSGDSAFLAHSWRTYGCIGGPVGPWGQSGITGARRGINEKMGTSRRRMLGMGVLKRR